MKRNIVIAAVTAAALIGGGTATALAVNGDDGDEGATTRTSSSAQAPDDDADDRDDDGRDAPKDRSRTASSEVTAADAIAAALRHTPGTAVSADLEDEDDEEEEFAWEVDVLSSDDTWHSVRIDPATGKVLGSEKEDDDEDDTAEVRAALKGTSVTAEEAAKAAAAKGTVTSVDLDDDKPASWDVETRPSDKDWQVGLNSTRITPDPDDD
ncbi:PepSY domain-containing protein [Streptomyces sp. HMX87]|uniref:PepSY domain-containing protein n=1 Tax=Streptomyces sp. HMX87 TaxID=3390849 RepID=UPI003A879F5D